MRKKSVTVPSIIDETHSKLNDPDDHDKIHPPKDSDSRYTTSSPDSPISPENETNASIQPELQTTITDITSAMSSTETQRKKLSSPPPSNTTNDAHDDAEHAISPLDTFLTSEDITLLPPPTDDITIAANPLTESTQVDQSISNIQTPEAPTATSPPLSSADGDFNDQTAINLLPPTNTSRSPPSADSIHECTSTSNPVPTTDSSSPSSTLDDSKMNSAIAPQPVSTVTVSGEPALNNSTAAIATNEEVASPGGGKAKRSKRQKYQTPTAEQLETLVNGHLNDHLSISAAARRAGIARSTASSLMKKHKTQGSIPNRQPRGRTAPAKIQIEQAEWIDQYLRDNESATLEMIRVALLMAFPNIKQISLSGLQRNITLKCSRHLKRRRQNKRTEEP